MRTTPLDAGQLERLGMTYLGARQVLSGQIVTSQSDRDLLARLLLDETPAASPIRKYNLTNAWPKG